MFISKEKGKLKYFETLTWVYTTTNWGFSTGLILSKLSGSHFRSAPLVGVLTKVAYQGEFCGGKIPFIFSWKLWDRKGREIQCVNTVFSHSRSSSSALHCCLTSKREVVSRKSDSKPSPVLQIKAITLIGLMRGPLQPGEIRLFQLGPVPLIKGFQQNPPTEMVPQNVSFIWKGFSRKEIILFKEGFLGHFPSHSSCLSCFMSP